MSASTEATDAKAEVIDELGECAGLFKSQMEWQGALMAAINRVVYREDALDTEGLAVGDRIEIERLADIGKHLADRAWSVAFGYQEKAADMQGAQ